MINQFDQSQKKNSLLILENGEIFQGYGIGYHGTTVGELCFNTSMTGYQEIMTDPSYANQIISFTFPHIGITGTNYLDNESDSIYASGFIFNENISPPSNFRSELSIEKWLIKNKKIGITGIDTRNLTIKLRKQGFCKALISYEKNLKYDLSNLKKKLELFPSMENTDLASKVSTSYVYQWKNGLKKKENIKSSNNNFKNIIAVIDFGIKRNILKILEELNFKILVFPCNYSISEILKYDPIGVFLSNGPGDPKAIFKKIEKNLNIILNLKIPIFGICLGHQILALALGGKTIKMHHGHRGANHPIKNYKKQKIEITVQNHGFVVSKKIPSNVIITHKSLFDETVAGLKVKNKPFFSVQYHPEASPGPHDSKYLFNQFKKEILSYAKKK